MVQKCTVSLDLVTDLKKNWKNSKFWEKIPKMFQNGPNGPTDWPKNLFPYIFFNNLHIGDLQWGEKWKKENF